jgi:hypothetical protein
MKSITLIAEFCRKNVNTDKKLRRFVQRVGADFKELSERYFERRDQNQMSTRPPKMTLMRGRSPYCDANVKYIA